MSELPPGWEWTTLQDLAAAEPRAMTDGPFGSNLKSAHYVDSGPRVIRLQNIGFGEFIDEKAHIAESHFETLRAHEVRSGDLVIASLGQDLPRACLVPSTLGPAIVKADCIRVRLHPSIDRRYVNYALQRPDLRHAVADQIHGVGRPRLGMAGIKELSIPLPPRAEQERIVAAIEEHLSRLDAAEAYLQRVDTAAGVLLATARATIDRADWPRRQLQDVAEAQLGKMLSGKSRTGVGSTPYLRNRNVRWGTVDVSEVAVMDFTDAEREKFRLVAGDVLICEGGAGVGRTAVWRDELEGCCYQKALHRVRVGDALLPEFLAAYIRHFVESRQLEKHLSGVAIGHFPQEDLRGLPVPVPGVAVQRDWLEWFEAQAGLVEHAQAATIACKARSSLLRNSILAAAFSGQLVPQDSNDEPAAGLIERIRGERAAAAPLKRSRKAKAS